MFETVKARRSGNATVLTVPKSMKVDLGKEYVVFKGRDGQVVFSPKLPIFFESEELKDHDFRQADVFGNVGEAGKEINE